jgi:hypothetical protein
MSNYYYDEKRGYLTALAEVRSRNHDLTPFLKFGLMGVAVQAKRVLHSIENEVARAIFRNMMYDLFAKLETPKKRVIAERQLAILKLLLEHDKLSVVRLAGMMSDRYSQMKSPFRAFSRDLNGLIALGAVSHVLEKAGQGMIEINLNWPKEITESLFFERLKKLPRAKTSL